MHRYRLPPAILREIADRWTAGADVNRVAALTGVSSDRVRIRLYRVGVYEKGWPAFQGRVRGILATRGPELIAAHEAGATIPTLAASVGVAPVTPQKYMADLGAALYDDRGRPRKRTI